MGTVKGLTWQQRLMKAWGVPQQRFNDDYYCASIEDWENEKLLDCLRQKKIQLYVELIPTLVIGFLAAGSSWRLWFCLLSFAYLIVKAFTFLEELNENLRFVRHQLRVFRVGVRAANGAVDAYRYGPRDCRPPDVLDILSDLDREWEDPR